jgi:hypothetical protein
MTGPDMRCRRPTLAVARRRQQTDPASAPIVDASDELRSNNTIFECKWYYRMDQILLMFSIRNAHDTHQPNLQVVLRLLILRK